MLGGERGRASWEEWFERVTAGDFRPDPGSKRLLPLVFRALVTEDDAEIPGVDLLATRYRRSWMLHNRLVHAARPAFVALHEAGLDAMVIKGVSLAERVYGDRGVRWITDVDVVVREGEAVRALDVLLCHGWRSDDSTYSVEELFERNHAVALVDGQGGSIDLHRRLLDLSRAGLDEQVWDRAVLTNLGDTPVYMAGLADELLVALVHGWAWSRVPSIRWIPDVAAIAPQLGPDDWTVLIDESRRRQVSYRVWAALRAVQAGYDISLPTWVIDELANGPFAPFESAEARWHTRAHRRVPPGVFAYFNFVRRRGSPTNVAWWMEFARYYASLVGPPQGVSRSTWAIEKIRRRQGRGSSTLRGS